MIDKAFCDKVSEASLGGFDVKYNTWDLCERVIEDGLTGDFAECGVYKGAHPMIMAEVARRNNDNRKIHLFDSFEGVPKVTAERDQNEIVAYGESEVLESSGVAYAEMKHCKDAFRANDAPLDNCVFHPGWFQDVIPFSNWPQLSILRLDVDLLESNEICFYYLYPKLQIGGYFITDDWGHNNTGTADIWRTEFKRLMRWMGYEMPEVHQVENEDGTAYWKKV